MRTIDMFRTEKQQKIIQSLERIKMGTNSDIVRDANGRVDHSLIASYGKHLKVLMDDGVIKVCGRIAENIPVYCLTYHVVQRPPAQGWGIVSDVATPIHSVG